jgi:hypothetical protein
MVLWGFQRFRVGLLQFSAIKSTGLPLAGTEAKTGAKARAVENNPDNPSHQINHHHQTTITPKMGDDHDHKV